MHRRTFMASMAAAASPAILTRRYRIFAGQQEPYSARAIQLVDDTVVVDLLNQWRFADYSVTPPLIDRWLHQAGSFTAADFETYRTSGIRVFCLGDGARDYDAGIRFFADWNGFIAQYPSWLTRVSTAADFARVKAEGRIGIMLTFQTSDHFRSPDDVEVFWSLGQRLSQLTYNFQNSLGAGFLETNDGGLSVFGHRIMERMQRVGMAVDASHCGDRTTLDILAAAQKPVVFSHAACRALAADRPRLKTDEMIRGLARSGGVMGIPLIRFMIRAEEPVTVEHVIDHYDHVARLVGVEHVAMGGDLDVIGNPNPVGRGDTMRQISSQANFDRYYFRADPDGRITVRGLDHARRVYDLTEGLIRRRYSDADIRLILGGNAARVFATIWGG